jgi:GxxExxY protein
MDDPKFTNIVEPSADLDILATKVIEAALEVHRALGPGLLERHYEQALAHELTLRSIPFEQQVPVSISYKGNPIGDVRLDLLVGGRLILGLKSIEALLPLHRAQMLTYLRAADMHLGLLINFNVALLKFGLRRVVLHHRYRA